ncbi:hypothetical protein ACHAXH_000836 [Discostella pseudostelligera]
MIPATSAIFAFAGGGGVGGAFVGISHYAIYYILFFNIVVYYYHRHHIVHCSSSSPSSTTSTTASTSLAAFQLPQNQKHQLLLRQRQNRRRRRQDQEQVQRRQRHLSGAAERRQWQHHHLQDVVQEWEQGQEGLNHQYWQRNHHHLRLDSEIRMLDIGREVDIDPSSASVSTPELDAKNIMMKADDDNIMMHQDNKNHNNIQSNSHNRKMKRPPSMSPPLPPPPPPPRYKTRASSSRKDEEDNDNDDGRGGGGSNYNEGEMDDENDDDEILIGGQHNQRRQLRSKHFKSSPPLSSSSFPIVPSSSSILSSSTSLALPTSSSVVSSSSGQDNTNSNKDKFVLNLNLSTKDNYGVKHKKFYGPYKHIRANLDYEYHGNYSKSRQELQDAIVHKLLDGTMIHDTTNGRVCKTPTEPWIMFTAGVMGAGKSHTMKQLASQGLFPLHSYVVVDPDEIRSNFPEYHLYAKECPKVAGELTHTEAGYVTEIVTAAALQQGHNVLVDGSLRDYAWYRGYFKSLREEYGGLLRIAILHITAPREVVFERAANRAKNTGRVVPIETLEKSLEQVPVSVKKLAPLADFFCELDNSQSTSSGGEVIIRTPGITWNTFRANWAQTCPWTPAEGGKQLMGKM